MFMKQRVKQLAITERSVKMKKIVAVVIIMFIFSIIILGVGSKLVFQKICERRKQHGQIWEQQMMSNMSGLPKHIK